MWICYDRCHERPDFVVVKRTRSEVVCKESYQSNDEELERPITAAPNEIMPVEEFRVCSVCGREVKWCGERKAEPPTEDVPRELTAEENVYRVTWVNDCGDTHTSAPIVVPACNHNVVAEYLAVVTEFLMMTANNSAEVAQIRQVVLVESR